MIRRLSAHALLIGVATLLIVNIALWGAISTRSGTLLTVSFLNVGQGDAIFIETPSGNQMLIDAGPDTAILRELGAVMPFFDRSIDIALMTHPDKDHIGGFPEVFDRFKIRYAIEPGVLADTGTYAALEERIEYEPSEKILARRGMRIVLDEEVYFDVLFPDRDPTLWETNQASIVGKLVYGNTSIMFTGDAPLSSEEYLAALDGGLLDSDVLKVGHHGSRTSTSEAFIQAVSPKYGVISAGKGNSYGHPHKEVTNTLTKYGVAALGTYDSGRIVFVSDGIKVWRK